MLTVRHARSGDANVLLSALAIAADWRPGACPRPPQAVLGSAELARYLPDLTTGADRALIADVGAGRSVGAAWWRFFDDSRPGYGFVSADVPEVSVGVVEQFRGQGVGTSLLGGLIALAVEQGVPALSLSVERDNEAMVLYSRLGFVRVGRNGGADTMLLTLR